MGKLKLGMGTAITSLNLNMVGGPFDPPASTMYGYDLFQQILTPQQQIDYGNIGAIEADNMQSQNPKGTPCP